MKKEKTNLEVEENEVLLRKGLFVFPEDEKGTPHLIGGKCKNCGDICFPKRLLCDMCDSEEPMEEILIGEKGILDTYAVVRVGYPGYDLPYIMANVTLPEGKDLQVVAQLEDCEPEEVRIGMSLALTTGKIKTDISTGKDVIAYKYRPVRD
jgi:uncharacterized OB-fold protein